MRIKCESKSTFSMCVQVDSPKVTRGIEWRGQCLSEQHTEETTLHRRKAISRGRGCSECLYCMATANDHYPQLIPTDDLSPTFTGTSSRSTAPRSWSYRPLPLDPAPNRIVRICLWRQCLRTWEDWGPARCALWSRQVHHTHTHTLPPLHTHTVPSTHPSTHTRTHTPLHTHTHTHTLPPLHTHTTPSTHTHTQTFDQFLFGGCDNCERFLRMKGNRDRVTEVTSSNFDG